MMSKERVALVVDRVRIGMLGAAKIAERALVSPARQIPEVTIAAVAARDRERARQYAGRLGVPRVHEDYDALLADPDIDAVYLPLPNTLHGSWAIRALEAGKHVLCEKPVTSNAAEAEQLAEAAARTGLIVCEAVHPCYHGLFDRVRELLAANTIGAIRHVTANVSLLTPGKKDNRWRYEMGGGALMDVGVYALAILRTLAGMEPAEVTRAIAKTRMPNVDRRLDATLRFPNGASGRIVTSMWGWPPLAAKARLRGTEGTLTVHNPIAPHLGSKIEITVGGRTTTEKPAKLPDSYTCQLRAFADAVLHDEQPLTGPDHFVANMRAIDAIYRKAGLPLRGMTP
jgi:predicted dehydrogenase